MKQKNFIGFIFFNFSLFWFIQCNAKESNVLIIHSYHQGLEWTDNINEGIQSIFDYRPDIKVTYEYLDTKRNFSEQYFNSLKELYAVKAQQFSYKAIIVSDNAAFNFIQQYSKNQYPETPIIYCGVNNLDTTLLSQFPNFYGIGEKADHRGTISAIKEIFPERKNILIVNDQTLTGLAIREELNRELEKFDQDLNFEIYSDFSFNDLQKKVSQLDETYVIYLLVINRDNQNKFISYRDGIELIQKSTMTPIFGSWDFYLGKGILGGSITSGFDQGKHAAIMAKNIVDDRFNPRQHQFSYIKNNAIFDFNVMENYGLKKSDLPQNSTIINKTKTIDLALKIAFGIISFLFTLVLLLIISLKIRENNARKLEIQVLERTEELNITNEKLANANEEKNKFFSILAHDLRDSISTILSSSLLLTDKELQLENNQKEKVLVELHQIAQQTNFLLEDLFFWGVQQFKRNRSFQPQDNQLYGLINEIVHIFQINPNNVTFNIEIDPAIYVHCDVNILKFICRNIIQNAIKFSHKGGTVKINSKVEIEDVHICIEDYGIGMSNDVIESIKSGEAILKENTKGKKSTGLGMETALNFLKNADGKLKIVSTLNKGSIFTVILKGSIKK